MSKAVMYKDGIRAVKKMETYRNQRDALVAKGRDKDAEKIRKLNNGIAAQKQIIEMAKGGVSANGKQTTFQVASNNSVQAGLINQKK